MSDFDDHTADLNEQMNLLHTAAAAAINDWADITTHGRIKEHPDLVTYRASMLADLAGRLRNMAHLERSLRNCGALATDPAAIHTERTAAYAEHDCDCPFCYPARSTATKESAVTSTEIADRIRITPRSGSVWLDNPGALALFTPDQARAIAADLLKAAKDIEHQRVKDSQNDEPDHYHVAAVQDAGGSQECWRTWDDRWNREQAEDHAATMADADSAYVSGSLDRYEAAVKKYGEDRFSELHSDNVAPGWNAIWIVPCTADCVWDLYGPAEIRELEPYWAPQEPGQEKPELRLVTGADSPF